MAVFQLCFQNELRTYIHLLKIYPLLWPKILCVARKPGN